MLKKIGISAFLLVVSVTQAFAEGHGHHGAESHDVSVHANVGHGAAHAAEHATSAGLPQLDPSTYTSQAIWLIGVFVFMFIFFSKKTVPQISKTIENRAERVSADLDTAEKLKNEVSELQKSYEEKLTQAREESYSVFVNTEKEIKQESERYVAEFQDRANKEVERLDKNISSARDTAIKEMSDVAAEVASQATEKIIGVKTDEKTAKAAVKSVNNKAA